MTVSAQEEELRQAVALLDDDDILALCYAFQGKVDRLRLYLDVLRKRSGYRAQFSSCLICFDLARQGDTACQREFLLLSETIRYLGKDQVLVNSLLANAPYLIFVWDLCKAALAELDPLAANSLPQPDPHLPVARLPLFDDSDFSDFRVKTDDVTMWRRFDEAVEAFLGGVLGVPIYDQAAGFRQNNKKDIERIESFMTHLDSLRDRISIARGFRALLFLFYGTQMRSRGVFGGINARKQQLLREGIQEFLASGAQVWEVAGVMGPMHAADGAWGKIADVLLDYLRWLAASPQNVAAGVALYDPVGRMQSRR